MKHDVWCERRDPSVEEFSWEMSDTWILSGCSLLWVDSPHKIGQLMGHLGRNELKGRGYERYMSIRQWNFGHHETYLCVCVICRSIGLCKN